MTGTLLLDPTDIEINNTGPNNNITGVTPFTPEDTEAEEGPSVLTWTTLLANLATADVLVTTDGSPDSGQLGNITITESHTAGDYNTGFNLTLTTAATGGIFFEADVLNEGSGGLIMNAGSGGIHIDTANIEAGFLTFNSAAGNVTLLDSTTLTSTAGDITFTEDTAVNADSAGDQSLTINASSNIVFETGANVGFGMELDFVDFTAGDTIVLRGVITEFDQDYAASNYELHAVTSDPLGAAEMQSDSRDITFDGGAVQVFSTLVPDLQYGIRAESISFANGATLDLGPQADPNAINTNNYNLALTTSSVDFTGAVTSSGAGGGTLLIRPLNIGDSFGVATAFPGDDILNEASLLNLDDTLGLVVIGRQGGTGQMTIGDEQVLNIEAPIVFRMNGVGGDIFVVADTILNGINTTLTNGSLTGTTPTLGTTHFRFLAGTGAGSLTFDDGTQVNVSSGDILFSSDVISLPETLTSNGGLLLLQPATSGAPIFVNTDPEPVGEFFLDQDEINAFAGGGFSGVVIGQAGGSHAIQVGQAADTVFDIPVLIRAPASTGTITTFGTIYGMDLASIGLNAGQNINLGGDVLTEGGTINLLTAAGGSIDISTSTRIASTEDDADGGDITISTAFINDSGGGVDLDIDAGTENVFLTVNDSTTRSLEIIGDEITLTARTGNLFSINTTGIPGQLYDGNVVLASQNANFNAAGANDIIFNGTVTRAGSGPTWTLNATSVSGDIVFNGQIGTIGSRLTNIFTSTDGTTTFGDDVFAVTIHSRGAFSPELGTTVLTGEMNTSGTGAFQLYQNAVRLDGDVIVSQIQNNTPITFQSTVDSTGDGGIVSNENGLSIVVANNNPIQFQDEVGQAADGALGDLRINVNNVANQNSFVEFWADVLARTIDIHVGTGAGLIEFGDPNNPIGDITIATYGAFTDGALTDIGQRYQSDVQLNLEGLTTFDTTNEDDFDGGQLLFTQNLILTQDALNDLTVITGNQNYTTGAIGVDGLRLGEFNIFSRGTSTLNGDIFAVSLTTNEDANLDFMPADTYIGEGVTVLNGITIDTWEDQTYNSAVQSGGAVNTLLANTDGVGADGVTFNYTLNGTGVGNNNMVINPNGLNVTFSGSDPAGDPVGNIYVFNAGDIILNENLITPANNALRARSFAAEGFDNFIAQGGELETTGSSAGPGALNYGVLNPGAQITDVTDDFGINIIARDDILVGADAQELQSRLETLNGNALLLDAINIMVQAADGTNSSTDAQIISSGIMNLNATNLLQVRGGMGDAEGAQALVQSEGDMTLTADAISVLGGAGSNDDNTASIISNATGDDAQRITVRVGDFLVQGGTIGDNNTALVAAEDGKQTIVVQQGDFIVQGGGSGTGNSARVIGNQETHRRAR